MKTRGEIKLLFIIALLFCFATTSYAADNWKVKQDEMFAKIGLKPGDKIDTSNWEKVKDLLPFSVAAWVKKGDLPITIGEYKFDASPDEAWKKASAANAGKYDVDQTGALIDAQTKKIPDYVFGEPFPVIEENDPNAGVKLIWNYDLKKARVGTWHTNFGMEWIGRNGFEKKIVGNYLVYYYNCRPDGPQDNPNQYMELSLFPVVEPYDVQGLVQLNRKFISDKQDDVYAYIPAIRRVKKLSGANRSDPSVGSDFILDDSNGWSGKNTTMKWKFIEKTTVLVPQVDWNMEAPLTAMKQSDGSWLVEGSKTPPTEGYNDPNWKGAPWFPMNIKWAPREVYVVEAEAKDPYYSYGKCTYYIDRSMGICFKIIYNKAREYWKTLLTLPMIVDYNGNRDLGSAITWYGSVDDKAEHTTTAPCYGTYGGSKYWTKFTDPNLVPAIYVPTQMATMTR
ncbi:MAG: DUF1329 domain-containing protein [Desulfobacterales bacterium]|nr:DUF1329 domain-containing protein [Desulfobacterales bacterium]